MILVLLVDDNPALFNITKLLLEKDGKITVDICNSASEAREKLTRRDYHVIVSDYDMPGEDGITFLRSLRASGYSVPFILFTGKGNERVAMEACNAGADYYMTKSGPAPEVFRTLRETVVQAAQGIVSGPPGKRQHDLHARIFESMSDLLLVLDSHLRIVTANPAAGHALGKPAEDLPPLPFQQFLSRESSSRLGEATNHLMQARSSGPERANQTLLLEVNGGSGDFVCYQAIIDRLPGFPGSTDSFLIVGRRVVPE